jgi:hypothetical protein
MGGGGNNKGEKNVSLDTIADVVKGLDREVRNRFAP